MSSALATLVVVHHRRLSLNNNNNNPVIWVMRNNNNNNASNNCSISMSSGRKRKSKMGLVAACSSSSSSSNSPPPASESGGGGGGRGGESLECVGTGLDVECLVVDDKELEAKVGEETNEKALLLLGMVDDDDDDVLRLVWDWVLLLSPFFFWGTSMVAMKEVLPKAGPFFVSAFRLIPAGLLLVSFASWKGRRMPCGFMAWLSITLFALVDSTCFQGFLAVGLQSTSAGLGSVIIDSQPLTVALLASLFFGESITLLPAAGLLLGVVGLLLLELPPATSTSTATALDHNFSLWESSGEWWMFLAAQSMAVGTVMVRWVSKYSDPIMATGWHMVIGGLPLFFISLLDHNPAAVVAVAGTNHLIWDLTSNDFLALLYTSIFGSAISYGVFFYNATTGSLTKLSSLTFLTPMFASIFGFIYLGETYSPVQVVGAMVTVLAIYMVNCGKGGRE